jgi:hypothetical protein
MAMAAPAKDLVLKVSLDADVRRLQLGDVRSYAGMDFFARNLAAAHALCAALRHKLAGVFPHAPNDFVVRYMDEEKDLVTISSDEEFAQVRANTGVCMSYSSLYLGSQGSSAAADRYSSPVPLVCLCTGPLRSNAVLVALGSSISGCAARSYGSRHPSVSGGAYSYLSSRSVLVCVADLLS